MDRVIPPFYACYLLRSTVRHQNLYVGSTPHPVRRLKQHNGLAKGGAVRTSRDSLRPWEMTCLVTGFPSKISALQFEWAWQNTHQTRHIAVDERITQAHQRTKVSPKTGKTRRKAGRPRISLTDKLANLHILLRAKSFERWPLEVRFFAPDVFKFWERTTAKMPEVIRRGIKIGMDQSVLDHSALHSDAQELVGIQALDVTFQPMKAVLAKSRALLASNSKSCSVCHEPLDSNSSLILVCYADDCESASHAKCLSRHFLDGDVQPTSILPTEGSCPECRAPLCWTDLVRDLSLRIRGDQEVAALFRERRTRKKLAAKGTSKPAVLNDNQSDSDLTEMSEADFDPTELLLSSGYQNVDDVERHQEEDNWQLIDEVVGNPSSSRPDVAYSPLEPSAHSSATEHPEKSQCKVVIEDSDWDEAEVIV